MSKKLKDAKSPKKENKEEGGKKKFMQQKAKKPLKLSIDVSKEKVEEYKDMFDKFDRDGSGEIEMNELYKLLKATGREITNQNAQKFIEQIDANGDGIVTFEEYVILMEKDAHPDEMDLYDWEDANDKEDVIIKSFKVFDIEKKGVISAGDFRMILSNMGSLQNRFTDEEIDRVMKEADIDPFGWVDYREFVYYWKSKI